MAWDLLDEDCGNISGWADLDNVNGVSSQVTFDSKSCFSFDTNAVNSSRAYRTKNIGSSNNYTIEINLYCDAISAAVNDAFQLLYDNDETMLRLVFRSDGLFIRPAAGGYAEIGTDLVVQDTWQKWRLEVTGGVAGSATMDVYLDDVLKESSVDCGEIAAGTAGLMEFILRGYAVADRIAYIDYIKVKTGLGIALEIDVHDCGEAIEVIGG